jgi:hypothetical protein
VNTTGYSKGTVILCRMTSLRRVATGAGAVGIVSARA